ncbi:glypican-6 [Elysia marginata]|uniref:Glypican-6 n=1 Tax=Elysia marginata TaxID=1093978 RepID=A0AAV4J6B7_9GAST|nr:glypican-6 [Elysia marginata]
MYKRCLNLARVRQILSHYADAVKTNFSDDGPNKIYLVFVLCVHQVIQKCGDISGMRKTHMSPIPRSKREAQVPTTYQRPAPQSPRSPRPAPQSPRGSTRRTVSVSYDKPRQSSRKQQHTFDMRRRQGAAASSSGGRRKSSKSRHNSRDCSKSGNCLDKLVRDLKEKLKPAKNFWTNLPYMACQEESLAADATEQDDCWNGTDRAR